MAGYSRLILQFAATTGIAAMMATAVPAMAAEGAVSVSAAVKATPSAVKRHAWRGSRIPTSYVRRVNPVRSDTDCSGSWCGRHFVLMVGIGF